MDRTTFFWLSTLCTIVYAIGFGVEVMGVDSAQYALISREMVETGEYLQVKLRGNDYLDKPPLLFWVSSLMFNVFGYSNWSFKLGSFLFTLLGVYSTFRLGKLLYNASTGRLAAIILYSCQAFFLFNNDVRTDTILSGAVIFAIWQMMEWLHHRKWKWLIGASVGIAMAMLAKGPIGLMVPVLAIGSFLIGKKRWRDFFRWEYLVLLVLVALLLSPMLWGLYMQYDMHPEKSVLMPASSGMIRETNVSGLRFYLWTQSFGRITGESVWSDTSGPFFFVHNLLWSFLPWALLFVMAFFWQAVRLVRRLFKNEALPEFLTIGGFLLPFIAFSMSSFKLPHYIFVLYPLAAILTAHWWMHIWEHHLRRWKIASLAVQVLVILASAGVLYLLYSLFFPDAPLWKPLTSIALLGVAAFFFAKGFRKKLNIIVASVLVSVAANFSLNSWFYPQLMQYQAGEELAEEIRARGIVPEELYHYRFHPFAFSFYMDEIDLPMVSRGRLEKALETRGHVYVLTQDPHLDDLEDDFSTETLHQMGTHSVTRLSMNFLDPQTRPETLTNVYLVRIGNE